MSAKIYQRIKHDDSSALAVLLVSLYLMLLAFFLMLQSISTFDAQRAKEVKSSLDASFDYQAAGKTLATSERVKSAPTVRDLYEEIKKILDPFMADMELEVLDIPRKQLRLRLPIDALMNTQEPAWNADGVVVLEALSALLMRWERTGAPVFFRLEFEEKTLNVGPSRGDIAAFAAQSLQAKGVASRFLSAAVATVDGEDMIWSMRMDHAK